MQHSKMTSSVVPIYDHSDTKAAPSMKTRLLPLFIGTALFFWLVFTTVTVFVCTTWALQTFQIGIFALLAVYLLATVRGGGTPLAPGFAPWLVYAIPLWGVFQLVEHITSSTMETRGAVLRWGALASVFFLSQVIASMQRSRRMILDVYLCFATALAVLCLLQLFTSDGLVLWLFSSGYPDVYATFASRNNYAQFVELALPVALWRAQREGWRSWWYGLSAGILYASAIGCASRAGAVLCTAELLTLLAFGLTKLWNSEPGLPMRSTVILFMMVPFFAVLFTLATGWERTWQRFQEDDPFLGRREYIMAAMDMAKHNPLTGYGLDTFPEVYPRYAIKDFPVYVNHAHNDWAEFAADGGIPFLLLIALPFIGAIPIAIRNPWGLGLIPVMLHACVDYPFPRPAVSGWMFAMLGLLYMTRAKVLSEKTSGATPIPLVSDAGCGSAVR
jgi:O-antigen ligase